MEFKFRRVNVVVFEHSNDRLDETYAQNFIPTLVVCLSKSESCSALGKIFRLNGRLRYRLVRSVSDFNEIIRCLKVEPTPRLIFLRSGDVHTNDDKYEIIVTDRVSINRSV